MVAMVGLIVETWTLVYCLAFLCKLKENTVDKTFQDCF